MAIYTPPLLVYSPITKTTHPERLYGGENTSNGLIIANQSALEQFIYSDSALRKSKEIAWLDVQHYKEGSILLP